MSVYGFRFYFTPLNGVLFTFPSRYLCTIGRRSEYLALDRGRPRFRQGSSCPAVLRYRITESASFRVRGFHALCQTFPNLSAIKQFYPNSAGHPHAALQPRSLRFRLLRFRSPLLTESLLISFPVLLRWFTSHSFSLPAYFIQPRSAYIAVCGLPHSVIPVSLDMCSSTRLFAAYHDLLRLASPQQASAIDLYLLDHIIHSAYLLYSSLSKTVQAISSTKLVLFLSVAVFPS